MVIRKYTKKRRRRSLRKLIGGTVTIDRVNERKTARIAPDWFFTRESGFDAERRRDGRRAGPAPPQNARPPRRPRALGKCEVCRAHGFAPADDGERERGSF
mgnify:CR=1 FL=1